MVTQINTTLPEAPRPTTPLSAPQLPWHCTPLQESPRLSALAGCHVLMKLDLLQPSGSFKSRGVGNLCLKALAPTPISSPTEETSFQPKKVKFYSSSGGNAGLAAVSAAKMLGCDALVVVPETTTAMMMGKIRAAGGEVIQAGASWKEADDHLHEVMKQEVQKAAEHGIREKAVYCPPFDHPDIWEGNSTLISEILQQIPDGPAPAGIIASVGGGGLLCGIQLGLAAHHMDEVPVVAVETSGAASLAHALARGNNNEPLPAITSIATSLGARKVADMCFELGSRPNVRSVVLSDGAAARACVRFADEERMIVEAACGVSLAVIYEGMIPKLFPGLKPEDRIIVVVCGGSNVNLDMLNGYRKTYAVSA